MNQYPESRNAHNGEVSMVLNYSGYKYKRFSDEFRLFIAPCCNHRSRDNHCFSINCDTGMWKCHYTACEKSGNWLTFCRLVGHNIPKDDRYVDRTKLISFKSEWTEAFAKTERSPVSLGKYLELLKYCNARGISNETLDAFRVSSKGNKIVQFPIFAYHEEKWQRVNARNVKCISEENDYGAKNWFEVKGGPTHLLMGNHLLDQSDPNKRAFIFEGQWDMMTAYEIGLRNVFSLPNGAGNIVSGAMLQYIPRDWTIYVCMDMDSAGYKATVNFYNQIGSENFARLVLPYKDLNEWWQKDRTLTVNDVLATARRTIEDKEEKKWGNLKVDKAIVRTSIKPIIETPWSGLTDYLAGGFYPGQITSILAASGSGKTTIVNQIAIYAASKGIGTGLISLEDTHDSFVGKLLRAAESIKDGMTIGADNLKYTQLEGQQTPVQHLINEIDSMFNNGCQLVVIDNVNFISDDARIQTNILNQIISCIKGRNVHAIIVNQPKKISPNAKVTSEDQKGFSAGFQGVWNHINVNSDPTNPSIRCLHVEKCREQGNGINAFVYVSYLKASNIYEEIPLQALVAKQNPDGLRIVKKLASQIATL